MVRIETALNTALWANKGGSILCSAFFVQWCSKCSGGGGGSARNPYSQNAPYGHFIVFGFPKIRNSRQKFPKIWNGFPQMALRRPHPHIFTDRKTICPIAYKFRTRYNRGVKPYFTT